jgi:hypothetical protein
MHRPLQNLAVVLWIISLLVPTAPTKVGGYVLGYELLVGAAKSLLFFPFSLFFAVSHPLHLFAFAANALFVREVLYFSPRVWRPNPPSLVVLFTAFMLSAYVGLAALGPRDSRFTHIDGILQLPGYYLWVGAFFSLLLARGVGQPDNRSNDRTASGNQESAARVES